MTQLSEDDALKARVRIVLRKALVTETWVPLLVENQTIAVLEAVDTMLRDRGLVVVPKAIMVKPTPRFHCPKCGVYWGDQRQSPEDWPEACSECGANLSKE